jgi:signal transduction histidine kinase
MDGWRHRLVDGSVLVALLGLIFVIGGVGLWYLELVPRADSLHAVLFDLVMHVLFGGVILALGVHIERSELAPRERFSVIIWCYGGFTLMFALSVLGHLGSILNGVLTLAFVSDFFVFASLGGAFGSIAGVNRGRAIRNETLAEENREQSETLAMLTRLLSHDIRNDLAVILSYTELLTEHVDEEGQSHIEVVQNRVGDTVRLLKDASTLVKSLDDEKEFEIIDLSAVLDKQVKEIREDHSDVEIESEIPSGITIEADSLVHQLFSNLLQNAVFHNDNEDLTINVTAEQNGDSVDVTVSDNGKGIPPEMSETCFELGKKGTGSEGDGIGLDLVSRLPDIYFGSFEADDSPIGAVRLLSSPPTPRLVSDY